VDPTLLGELSLAGYDESRAKIVPASVVRALAAAPPRRPARPDPAARWRAVEVDEAAGAIRRPPGLQLDVAGSAKGWAADLLGSQLERQGRFAVDCGGDLRLEAGRGAPWEVRVRHPLTGAVGHTLHVREGGVATSGIDARLWQREGGDFAHHLIDPSTGAPAWTGLVAATALAPSALEAEALAKAALLSGPKAGRRLLRARHGGVLVHDDGAVELVNRRRRRRARVNRAVPLRQGRDSYLWPLAAETSGGRRAVALAGAARDASRNVAAPAVSNDAPSHRAMPARLRKASMGVATRIDAMYSGSPIAGRGMPPASTRSLRKARRRPVWSARQPRPCDPAATMTTRGRGASSTHRSGGATCVSRCSTGSSEQPRRVRWQPQWRWRSERG